MVIHVNKSSLSYKQICEHYINASDATPIADGTGDFIIAGVTSISQTAYPDCQTYICRKSRAEKWKLKSMNLSVQEKI